MWLVKEGSRDAMCEVATPIKCGSIVRLEHIDTTKNLHSHQFKAPLSGNQEVSGFGDAEGRGDTGDNWVVQCQANGAVYWDRSAPISFIHQGVYSCVVLVQ